MALLSERLAGAVLEQARLTACYPRKAGVIPLNQSYGSAQFRLAFSARLGFHGCGGSGLVE